MGVLSYFFGRTPEKEEVGKEIREAAAAFNKAINQAADLGLTVGVELNRNYTYKCGYKYDLKVNYVQENKIEKY